MIPNRLIDYVVRTSTERSGVFAFNASQRLCNYIEYLIREYVLVQFLLYRVPNALSRDKTTLAGLGTLFATQDRRCLALLSTRVKGPFCGGGNFSINVQQSRKAQRYFVQISVSAWPCREIFKALWLAGWRYILFTRAHGSPDVWPAQTGVYPELDFEGDKTI